MTLSQWKTLQRVFISAGIKPDSSCCRQDPARPGLASLQLALRFHSGNMDLLSATHQAPLCSPTSAFAVPGLWHGSSWLQVAGLLLFILISAPRFLLEAKRLPQNLTDAHPPSSHSLRVTGLLSSEPLSSLCVSISLGPQSVTNLRTEAPNCAVHCYRPACEQAWNMVGSHEILVESLSDSEKGHSIALWVYNLSGSVSSPIKQTCPCLPHLVAVRSHSFINNECMEGTWRRAWQQQTVSRG